MNDYRVDTKSFTATVSLVDGHQQSVILYVPPAGEEVGTELQLVLDFLNAPDQFLAVTPSDGHAGELLNKHQICGLEIEGVRAEEDDLLGTQQRVRLTFPAGRGLSGTIVNDLPETQLRVLDFLNKREAFFFLLDGEGVTLINRAAVIKATDD